MKTHIILSQDAITSSSPAFKRELATIIGLDLTNPLPSEGEDIEEDANLEFASLGLQAARAFLQNCNEKTKRALQGIVEQGESFSMAKLEKYMDVPVGASALKGVWTGLTKRTRTITGNTEAMLIHWVEDYEHDDWRGSMDSVTLSSFKVALSEL